MIGRWVVVVTGGNSYDNPQVMGPYAAEPEAQAAADAMEEQHGLDCVAVQVENPVPQLLPSE